MLKVLSKRREKNIDKGFTLVELIVVIAILAILAVALTPRLTHYLDKARKSNDNQVIDAMGTAVKLALVDNINVYDKIATDKLGKWIVVANSDSSGDVECDYQAPGDPGLQAIIDEIQTVVSGDDDEFSLQSDDAKKTGTNKYNYVVLCVTDQYKYELRLYYNVENPINADGTIKSITPAYRIAQD